MAKRYAYLVKVNSENNNNKFYEVTEQDNGKLETRYGRIGAKGVVRERDDMSFEKLVHSKINEGYSDATMYHAKTESGSKQALDKLSQYKPIENKDVKELMELLVTSSREFMQTNYNVKVMQITEKAILDAEQDIAELVDIATSNNRNNKLYDFNCKLEEDLFHRIERKMDKVDNYLAKTEDDFSKIINREQTMLDNLKGIVEQENKLTRNEPDESKDYLEANGLSVRPVTYKEEDQIIAHLGRDYGGQSVERRYVKGFAVNNDSTRKAYEDFKAKEHIDPHTVKLFYHGSKVENWNSIMSNGLSLNPNATVTGKMFGRGIYFAPDSRKSLNYMDTKGTVWNSGQRDTGYMGIYAVALGKQYEPHGALSTHFSKNDLPAGTNSVYADKNKCGLQNDEYVIYDKSACTIKYLLEMKSNNTPELTFNLDRKKLRDKLSESFSDLVKTSEGLRCEINTEKLPVSASLEISDKITNGFAYNKIYIDYNSKSDKISFSVGDSDNISKLSPNLTNHDLAFFTREMKKTFTESELQWKDLVKSSENIEIGKSVISHSDDKNLNTPKKEKNEIERD